MDGGNDSVLTILDMLTNLAGQNIYSVVVSVIVIFGAYGLYAFQRKKARERQIENDRQAARSDNIDVLEGETSESNDEVRRRIRENRDR